MKKNSPTVVFVSSPDAGEIVLNVNEIRVRLTKDQCFLIAIDLLREVRRWPDNNAGEGDLMRQS